MSVEAAGNGHRSSRRDKGEWSNRGAQSAESSYPTSVHQDTTSWLEQIQFKAQYHHFRTNNYVAVTSSAGLAQKEGARPSSSSHPTPQKVSRPRRSVEIEESSGDGDEASSASHKCRHPVPERQRQSLCWNFPRVNLRKFFSAKSLDELEVRGQLGPDSGRVRASASQLHPSSAAAGGPRPRSSSSDSHAPGLREALPIPTAARLSCASSDDVHIQHRQFQYNYPIKPQLISNCSSEDNCYLIADPVPVPANLMEPKLVSTITTKSDNCLDRVTTASSPVTTIGQFQHYSTTDVTAKSTCQIPIPTIVRHSPEPAKPKRRIHFNQVEPGDNLNGSGVGGERPRLVKASLAYLQRPVSPSTVTPLAYSFSDPSGTGMRSPATAGSRTPQALLSPTGMQPTSIGQRDICEIKPSTAVSPGRPISARIRSGQGFFGCCGSKQEVVVGHETSMKPEVEKTKRRIQASNALGIGNVDKGIATTSEAGSLLDRGTPHRSTAEGSRDRMADLKSPDFVQQSSRLLSAQNGSRGAELSGTDNVPTYVNVSRSVSGYTCLHYNGSEGTRQGHRLTSSSNTNVSTKFPSALPADYRPYISPFRKTTLLSEHPRNPTSTSPEPPSLPTSAPPLSSPSLVGRSRFLAERNHGDNGVERVNNNGSAPRPSKSSFILRTIEKLYGNQDMASSGYCRQRNSEHSPSPPRTNGKERIIPIRLDKDLAAGTRVGHKPAVERLVPILLEDSGSKGFEGVPLRPTPGRHCLLDESHSSTRQSLYSPISHGDHSDTAVDKDEVDDSGLISNPVNIALHPDVECKVPGFLEPLVQVPSKSNGRDSRGEDVEIGVGDSRAPLLVSNRSIAQVELRSVDEHQPSSGEEASDVSIVNDTPKTVLSDADAETEAPTPIAFQQTDIDSTMTQVNKENEFFKTERNGEYFLDQVRREKESIVALIEKASAELEKLDPSSEESGHIRTSIGKAKLLINKRFKQFEGLCNTNLEERKKGVADDEPFTTKDEDLAGFWDMVMIQVDQIHAMFGDAPPSGQATGSSIPTSKRIAPLKKVVRPSASSVLAKPKDSAFARDEARRKLLAEKRQAMKAQMKNSTADSTTCDPSVSAPDVQIFHP